MWFRATVSSYNTDKSIPRLVTAKLQKAMGIDYGPQSQITELNHVSAKSLQIE